MKVLRPYQLHGKELTYDAFRRDRKRIVYWLQTGGGKSLCSCDFTAELLHQGIPVVYVMRRRELISQMSANLDSHGIPHGIHMANHRRYRPQELVQVCSIDTLDARELYPHSNDPRTVVLVDESHDDTPKSRKYVALHEKYQQNHFIGFTATPFSDNSHYEEIICPISAAELRDQGHLVHERTFVPHQINLSGVKIVRGEFDEKATFEAASGSQIVGDFVRDWKQYAQGRRTFFYAINIEHSKIVCEAMNKAGIRAVHCDASTKSSLRKAALDDLKNHAIDIIVNVNLFSVGVDLPEVSCIQGGRPTMSLIWFLQAHGRGLRPAPWVGKRDCIMIDNAGNTLRHGTVYMPREATLDPKSKAKKSDEVEILCKRCTVCGFIMLSKVAQCPDCKAWSPKTERFTKMVDGELVEYAMTPEEREIMNRRLLMQDHAKLLNVARMKGYNRDWIHNILRTKHTRALFEKYTTDMEEQEERWKR